jgi:putative transcription factor
MNKVSCDICGRSDARAVILVEGAKMVACGNCMRSGKVLYRLNEEIEGDAEPVLTKRGPMEQSEEIVEGYGKKMRAARDKMGLKLAIVAEKINEKESYLDALETQRMFPTFEVAKKLERELGIKLIEKIANEMVSGSSVSKSRFSEPTLGDVLVTPKKKKVK